MTFLDENILYPSRVGRLIKSDIQRVLIFDYIDGIERGLIAIRDGTSVYFDAVGDSPSRLFKAYRIMEVGSTLQYIFDIEGNNGTSIFLNSEKYDTYQSDLFYAREEHEFMYYGVSDIGLKVTDYFKINEVDFVEPDFSKIHQEIKRRRASVPSEK